MSGLLKLFQSGLSIFYFKKWPSWHQVGPARGLQRRDKEELETSHYTSWFRTTPRCNWFQLNIPSWINHLLTFLDCWIITWNIFNSSFLESWIQRKQNLGSFEASSQDRKVLGSCSRNWKKSQQTKLRVSMTEVKRREVKRSLRRPTMAL